MKRTPTMPAIATARSGLPMGPNPRLVGANSNNQQIARPILAELGKLLGVGRIPGEYHSSSFMFQRITVVTAIGVALQPRSPMIDRNGLHPKGAAVGFDLDLLVPAEFGDLAQSG